MPLIFPQPFSCCFCQRQKHISINLLAFHSEKRENLLGFLFCLAVLCFPFHFHFPSFCLPFYIVYPLVLDFWVLPSVVLQMILVQKPQKQPRSMCVCIWLVFLVFPALFSLCLGFVFTFRGFPNLPPMPSSMATWDQRHDKVHLLATELENSISRIIHLFSHRMEQSVKLIIS